MGWQAIQVAMDVGDDLQQKKDETPHGEWVPNLQRYVDFTNPATANARASELMRLAQHRELIEEHKPGSMRCALALIPKTPRKTSEKQLQTLEEDLDKYQRFARLEATKQATILAKKEVKIQLATLQNDAHYAVIAENKAFKARTAEKDQRLTEMLAATRKERLFYEDLVNKRMNGYDWKLGLKLLRQAVHPDRDAGATPAIREKAMEAIRHFAQFMQV